MLSMHAMQSFLVEESLLRCGCCKTQSQGHFSFAGIVKKTQLVVGESGAGTQEVEIMRTPLLLLGDGSLQTQQENVRHRSSPMVSVSQKSENRLAGSSAQGLT